MSMNLVIGALQIFNAVVEEFGAQECDFIVGSAGDVKGTFWVRFLDKGVE